MNKIIAAALAVGLGVYLFRKSKENYKEEVLLKEKQDSELLDLGLKRSEVERRKKEVQPEFKNSRNVSKSILDNVKFSWDEKDLGFEDFVLSDENKTGCIHVLERISRFKKDRSSSDGVDLLIQLPVYNPATKSFPFEYVKSIREEVTEYCTLKNYGVPSMSAVGYYSYMNSSTREEIFSEIPYKDYESYGTKGGSDGLGRLVTEYHTSGKLEQSDFESIEQYVRIRLILGPDPDKNIPLSGIIGILKTLSDTYVGQNKLGPIVFHPGENLGEYYDSSSKVSTIVFDNE